MELQCSRFRLIRVSKRRRSKFESLMQKLLLKYNDENGAPKEVIVTGEKFIVGRHPENDLQISSSKLSREHIKIIRNGAEYTVEDVGSTNGTKLNRRELLAPEVLFDGDLLDLGGGVELTVEITSAESRSSKDEDRVSPDVDIELAGAKPLNAAPSTSNVSRPVHSDPGSGFGKFFLIAPLLVLFVLIFAGGAIFLLRGTGSTQVTRNNGDFRDDVPVDDTDENSGDKPDNADLAPSDLITPLASPENSPPSDGPDDPTPVPDSSPRSGGSENEKIERAAISFMRRIARNDPNPVLTSAQINALKGKINQFSGSSALAANIKDAKTNTAAITALARSKNLIPQFVVNAALTKLGNNRGNVLSTAESMLEVLDKLNIQIGDEVADDGLVTIAAYQQGVDGQFLQMRNTMERLARDNPTASSLRVRSIWFLQDKGKLSSSEFELALRFLAIGTITQNPEAFGVNAEALTFS